MACFNAWDIGVCGCGGSLTCRQFLTGTVYCHLIDATVYLSWTGGGPIAMPWVAATSRFQSANFTIAGTTVFAYLYCSSAYFGLAIIGGGGAGWLAGTFNFASYTCSPFHLDGSTSTGCNGGLCATLAAAGITDVYCDG